MTTISMGKLIKLKVPDFLCNLLKINESSHDKRAHLPKYKLNLYQNNFCYCNFTTNAPTINALKSRLKSFLVKMQIYGSEIERLDYNKSISKYLITIKKDPYYDSKS